MGLREQVRRTTRRTTTRRRLLAAGTGLAAAGWAGLWPAVGQAARLRRAAANPIVLTLVPNLNFPQWPITEQDFELLRQRALSGFLARNPHVQVKLYPDTNVLSGLGGATMAAMLAGDGPDVFADWVAPPFAENELVLDLSGYLKQDNVNMSEFVSGQLAYFRASALYSPTNPYGWYFMPGYLNTAAYVVDLGLVDQLGVKRPEPGWTYSDWTRFWEAVTLPGKRYGACDIWTGYDFNGAGISPYVLHGFGGGFVDPSDPARCGLGSAASIAAGEWFYGLVADKVMPVGGWIGMPQQVTQPSTTGSFTEFLKWSGLNWDYFEMPTWPVRRASWAATDFYAIWAGTKYPDQAWELLRAISVEREWQYFITRVLLMGPVQRSLWADWADIIRQAAPPLARKNLDAFVRPVLNDEPWTGSVYRYATEQASSIVTRYLAAVQNRQLSVPAAFDAATRQIDALEATGPLLSGQAAAALRTFQADVARAEAAKAPVLYPAPAKGGVGVEGTAAPQLVRRTAAGAWTVSGAGRGLHGPTDGGTFAAAAFRPSAGTFVCRLTAIAAVRASAISDGAKVGLMARGSLTDAAACAWVGVAMGKGIHFQVRSVAATNIADQKPSSPTQPTGLIGAAPILAPDSSPAANYLLKPVWLKLELEVDRWTAYTSLDGQQWAPAGQTALAEFAGAWVGLFVTSHQNGQYIRATFDHLLGFQPDTFVQIGSP